MFNRSTKIFLLSASAVALLLLCFFRLGAMGLTGPDEPRYAEVAKEMFLSHDYITPRLMGEPWFEKPALYYWCAALAYSAFGVNETAARIPSAVATCLLTLISFLALRPVLRFETRWLSSMIFVTSLGVISFSRAASTDMLLTATFNLAMVFFAAVLLDPSPPHASRKVLFAYLFLGLSTLAKGPVGIVFALGVLFLYFWITGRWDQIKSLQIPRGILLLILVAAPWYVLCYRANGWAFFDTFLIQHNVARFATNEFRHWRPLWFYFPVVLGGLLPWTFYLLLPAARAGLLFQRGFWKTHPKAVFWGLWIVIPFLFFTMAQSKLPGYILPVFLPLSLILGDSMASALPGTSISVPQSRGMNYFRLACLAEIFFFAFLLAFRHRIVSRFNFPVDGLSGGIAITSLLMIVILLYCVFSRFGSWISIGSHLLIIVAMVVVTCSYFLPRLDSEVSARPAARAILLKSKSPRVLTFNVTRSIRYGLEYYLGTSPETVTSLREIPDPRSGEPIFLVMPSKSVMVRADLPAASSTVLYESGGITVLKIDNSTE